MMNERRNISKRLKNKLASRPLRGVAAAGLVSGVAAASMVGVPTASATCIGFSGININFGDGGGCTSSLFGFALGLGPGTVATTQGLFNAAIAVGTDVTANAGTGGLDFLNLAANFGNATDGATSTVTAGGGAFNLAANLGGNANAGAGGGVGPQDMVIQAGSGFGNVALNVIGNRNRVTAAGGFLNFATTLGSFGGEANGSDNDVTATGSLSAAFNFQGPFSEACPLGPCGNTVTATGLLSLVAAIGVVQRLVTGAFGITLAIPFNSAIFPPNPNPPATNVLAAGGTQINRLAIDSAGTNTGTGGGAQVNSVGANSAGTDTGTGGGTGVNRVGINSAGTDTNGVVAGVNHRNRTRANSSDNDTNGVAASGTHGNRVRSSLNAESNRSETSSPGGSERKSVNDRRTKWSKKSSDSVSSSTSGSTGDAKTGADSARDCDK
jgi:hypothetical protein